MGLEGGLLVVGGVDVSVSGREVLVARTLRSA